MARVNITLPDELDKKFRARAGEKYGAYKGSLQKAIINAIEDWIKKK